MNTFVTKVRAAFHRLSSAIGFESRPLPALEDELRRRFDQEYEAILAEIAKVSGRADSTANVLRSLRPRVERRRFARTA